MNGTYLHVCAACALEKLKVCVYIHVCTYMHLYQVAVACAGSMHIEGVVRSMQACQADAL